MHHGRVDPISRRAVFAGIVLLPLATLGCESTAHHPDGALRTPLLTRDAFTVAHRGGSLDWPEMSMLAYDNAVALGANALEISLARTTDGVWFGLHDATLDRVAGTTGIRADMLTWAQVQQHRISATGTRHPDIAPQSFITFAELADARAASHTLFVDPKVVAARYWPELFALMRQHARKPTESFVAKGFCSDTRWAGAARDQGLTTWGYYYGAGIAADPALLTSTQQSWDLLGLDVAASNAAWNALNALGRSVIGHLIGSPSDRATVRGHGARGLMVSDPEAVLGS